MANEQMDKTSIKINSLYNYTFKSKKIVVIYNIIGLKYDKVSDVFGIAAQRLSDGALTDSYGSFLCQGY